MNKRRIVTILLVLCIGFIAGCGSKKNEVTIRGTVKVAGKPVDAGIIQFLPVNKDTFEGGGNITNGTFEATVPYGEMVVKFRGVEYVKKDADGNPLGGEIIKNESGATVNYKDPPSKKLVPDKYWNNSDVRVTVEDAKQPFDFDLDAN